MQSQAVAAGVGADPAAGNLCQSARPENPAAGYTAMPHIADQAPLTDLEERSCHPGDRDRGGSAASLAGLGGVVGRSRDSGAGMRVGNANISVANQIPGEPIVSLSPLADPPSRPRTTPAVLGLRQAPPADPASSHVLDEGTAAGAPGCALSAGRGPPCPAPARGCAERTQLTICDQLAFDSRMTPTLSVCLATASRWAVRRAERLVLAHAASRRGLIAAFSAGR